MSTRFLVCLLFIAIICLYIQYYTKFATSFDIIQSPIGKLTTDILYERQPIIISERLVHPSVLTKTVFKYTYMFMNAKVVSGDAFPLQTLHKYTVVYNDNGDMPLNLVHPSNKTKLKPFHRFGSFKKSHVKLHDSDIEFVTIKLKKQQCIIIPMHWLFQVDSPTYNVIALDDPISSLICFFQSTSST